jgi:hypothetical protein
VTPRAVFDVEGGPHDADTVEMIQNHLKTARRVGVVLSVPLIMGMSHLLGQKATGIILSVRDLPWVPEAAGLPQHIATLWGDRKTGEAGVLIKVPPSWHAGLHAHTADYDAVVIAGTWIHTIPSTGTRAVLAPGSYWRQPKEQMHDDQCEAGAECIVFVHTNEATELIAGAGEHE